MWVLQNLLFVILVNTISGSRHARRVPSNDDIQIQNLADLPNEINKIDLNEINKIDLPNEINKIDLNVKQTREIISPKRCSLTEIGGPLRFAAWNIQKFGVTKFGKKEVVAIIVEVIRRYDMIVLLEIVDKAQNVPKDLLVLINEGLEVDEQYSSEISPRIGRTTYKEQYYFIYKTKCMNVKQTYLFNDTKNDFFQIEPFIVVFGIPILGINDLAITPIHTSPSAAVEEISNLSTVRDKFFEDTNIKNMMIMGDFNAGCTYVTSNDWDDIALWTNKEYKWKISDHIDTTVKTTTCPYDRIVLIGDDYLHNSVYEGSAKPFYFDEEFAITDPDYWTNLTIQAEDVSDHYPIEISFKGKVPSTVESTNVGVAVKVEGKVLSSDIIDMIKNQIQPNNCNKKPNSNCADGQEIYLLEWTVIDLETTSKSLQKFSSDNPKVITDPMLKVLEYKLKHSILYDNSLLGDPVELKNLIVQLLCHLKDDKCSVTVTANTSIN